MAKRNVPAGGFFWAVAEYNHDTTLVEPKMRVTIMSANTYNRVTVHILEKNGGRAKPAVTISVSLEPM